MDWSSAIYVICYLDINSQWKHAGYSFTVLSRKQYKNNDLWTAITNASNKISNETMNNLVKRVKIPSECFNQ